MNTKYIWYIHLWATYLMNSLGKWRKISIFRKYSNWHFDMSNNQNNSELLSKNSCDRHEKKTPTASSFCPLRHCSAALKCYSEGWTVQMGDSLSSVQRGQQTEMKKINQTFPGNKVFLWDYNKGTAMSKRTKTWWQMISPPPSAWWLGGRVSTSILWVNSCETTAPFFERGWRLDLAFYYRTGPNCFRSSPGWIVFIYFGFSAGQTLSQWDRWEVFFHPRSTVVMLIAFGNYECYVKLR